LTIKKTFIGIWNCPNNRHNIQTYPLRTFTFSLQTFTIFFLINAFINVYYIFLTFITSMVFMENVNFLLAPSIPGAQRICVVYYSCYFVINFALFWAHIFTQAGVLSAIPATVFVAFIMYCQGHSKCRYCVNLGLLLL